MCVLQTGALLHVVAVVSLVCIPTAFSFHSGGWNGTVRMADGEKLVAEFPSVRHKKQDGVLLLTSARVAWSAGDHFQVNHPYQQIKGGQLVPPSMCTRAAMKIQVSPPAQRISAEGSSKVQLQLVLHSGSSLNFHFTGGEALAQRNHAKEVLQQLLPQFSIQANPDLEAKNSMLHSNPALYQLYKDLVVGGLISADEFWANRLHGVRQETETGSEQQSGLPSAFLADVQAVSDGCNAVKYNLTTDVIQAIFRTYPSVRAKHAELVPEKMPEKEFWGKFFQSQLFHRETGSGPKSLFSDVLVKEHKEMVQANGADESVLNTTELPAHTLGEGYSVQPECEPAATPLPLLQRCNHHSNSVLRALLNDSDSPPTDSRTLSTDSAAPSIELRLKPRQHVQDATTSSSSMQPLAQELAQWSAQQAVNMASAHSAVSYLVPGGQLMPSRGPPEGLGSTLSPEQREVLFRHQAAIAELLRHFWACFPPQGFTILTPQVEEKAHQMGRCLREYQDSKLPDLASNLGTDDLQVVSHLKTSIAMALKVYNSWQSKRVRT